jgi:dTDP-4-amino-4,6-dideoxygalactose transaminase
MGVVHVGGSVREDTRVPYSLPSIGEEEIAEVSDTLRSGWLTTGPKVRQFEQDFAKRIGASHAVAVNSCTAALHLALEAVGVGPQDEVILPTYTFAATGEVVTYLGAWPVLADCARHSYNVDASTIEPLLTPRTRAIVPVHIAGEACDMELILALARSRGIHVIEDAAHALPTTYRGQLIGTLGDLTVFSFYATKTMATGEGGMITTESERYAARVRSMSLHGLTKNAWDRYAANGSWAYEIMDFGFKYNMTDVAAAIGIHQLRKLDLFHQRRCEIAAEYDAAFRDMDGCEISPPPSYDIHARHLYMLRLQLDRLTIGRNEFVNRLAARGIGVSVHFIPLHMHQAYQKRYGYRPGDLPVAEHLFERSVSLPIYPRMTDSDVARVVTAVSDILKTNRR